MDLQLSSEDKEYDDEIMLMEQCVEMQLSGPIAVLGLLHQKWTARTYWTSRLNAESLSQNTVHNLYQISPSSHLEVRMDQ